MNYIEKLVKLINKKKSSLKNLKEELKTINDKNYNQFLSVNNHLINSFITINEEYSYKIIRKYEFNNIHKTNNPLMQIFNIDNEDNNEKEYVNNKLKLLVFHYLEKDDNYVLEDYEYINNKLSSYSCIDIDNKDSYDVIFKNKSIKTKDEDNNLLNVKLDYFDDEFKLLNIFHSDSNNKFGDYLKKIWIDNCNSNEHNLFESIIKSLILKLKTIDYVINKSNVLNTFNNPIKKDLVLDDEFRYIIGDLNINRKNHKDLNHVFKFYKLLLVFICKLENTNISIDQSMLLKYDGIIPDSGDNTFNSFINNVENSFNLIFMNENDSKCYKKLTNNLKNNNIVFSLKIILFNYYFEYIFNKNYYDYNDNKNYVSYLETMSNIKDIIEILVPSNFNENDLKNYSKLKVLINIIELSNIFNYLSIDQLELR
jgi:hypothetical protein